MNDLSTTKTILIADDDHFVIKAFKAGLERYDYNVIIAQDGEEALERIAQDRPDLVLLDVIMPKKDGFEVLKTVKADFSLASTPIIMLTSLGQQSDEQTALQNGAADFLVKSEVSLNDILVRVQRLLEDADEAAAATAGAMPATSTVPDLTDNEAATIVESIKSESEATDNETPAAQAVPQSTVPDLTQPVPVEAEAEASPTPDQKNQS